MSYSGFLFSYTFFPDDCQMVVRDGRAGVLLDLPHRHVHGRSAGPAASTIQRPRCR